jgi:hypothetical protein
MSGAARDPAGLLGPLDSMSDPIWLAGLDLGLARTLDS